MPVTNRHPFKRASHPKQLAIHEAVAAAVSAAENPHNLLPDAYRVNNS
jgi:hypothetical protein